MWKYQLYYRKRRTKRWLKTDHSPFNNGTTAWTEAYYLMEKMPKYEYYAKRVSVKK